MNYKAHKKRYEKLNYRRCGNSGLLLPPITLGLWHNFGGRNRMSDESKKMLFRAFDRGVTHFDLANNYGPPYGSAESNFGKIFNSDLKKYRDELIISTKAGYDMWDGPYGEWGSKKYLIASLDQSLKRMKLEYVDIFYSHRFDPLTPLEETADALAQVVYNGKSLYVGISSYSSKQTIIMNKLLKDRGVRCLIHQPSYSMINRWIEKDLIKTLKKLEMGCIAFSPLAQGMLSEKYLKSIPKNSRAAENSSLDKKMITKTYLSKISNLSKMAKKRGQTLSQMALAWVLRHPTMTSALIGARTVKQLDECLDSLNNLKFSKSELKQINIFAKEEKINLWEPSSRY
ncbi:MAG: L-glyceraldehyde 3-phosphate reductase [Pelagibacteraceae bacterium]|nr:L-glyceraldehyde 3-phosphate reductase [Pelagibacteraceae bacterium]PPR50642.1 MAG: L-glyceraldehyde 3-phosphate reductase [Alphaproteobacteria bacterium MarineAlpha5_Bin10]|tara:strand:+ start:28858 stop:29886 length:1029 start_codon:yes stop_codon:yes gene_type:complete